MKTTLPMKMSDHSHNAAYFALMNLPRILHILQKIINSEAPQLAGTTPLSEVVAKYRAFFDKLPLNDPIRHNSAFPSLQTALDQLPAFLQAVAPQLMYSPIWPKMDVQMIYALLIFPRAINVINLSEQFPWIFKITDVSNIAIFQCLIPLSFIPAFKNYLLQLKNEKESEQKPILHEFYLWNVIEERYNSDLPIQEETCLNSLLERFLSEKDPQFKSRLTAEVTLTYQEKKSRYQYTPKKVPSNRTIEQILHKNEATQEITAADSKVLQPNMYLAIDNISPTQSDYAAVRLFLSSPSAKDPRITFLTRRFGFHKITLMRRLAIQELPTYSRIREISDTRHYLEVVFIAPLGDIVTIIALLYRMFKLPEILGIYYNPSRPFANFNPLLSQLFNPKYGWCYKTGFRIQELPGVLKNENNFMKTDVPASKFLPPPTFPLFRNNDLWRVHTPFKVKQSQYNITEERSRYFQCIQQNANARHQSPAKPTDSWWGMIVYQNISSLHLAEILTTRIARLKKNHILQVISTQFFGDVFRCHLVIQVFILSQERFAPETTTLSDPAKYTAQILHGSSREYGIPTDFLPGQPFHLYPWKWSNPLMENPYLLSFFPEDRRQLGYAFKIGLYAVNLSLANIDQIQRAIITTRSHFIISKFATSDTLTEYFWEIFEPESALPLYNELLAYCDHVNPKLDSYFLIPLYSVTRKMLK